MLHCCIICRFLFLLWSVHADDCEELDSIPPWEQTNAWSKILPSLPRRRSADAGVRVPTAGVRAKAPVTQPPWPRRTDAGKQPQGPRVVNIGFGSDLTKDHDHVSLGAGLTSNLAVRIFSEACIKHCIEWTYLISDTHLNCFQ
jgi:hypothetical protein